MARMIREEPDPVKGDGQIILRGMELLGALVRDAGQKLTKMMECVRAVQRPR